MSRQSKMLREKKGTEEQKAKNARKADRFKGEIEVIKEVERDEVARFALRSKKRLDQVRGGSRRV